MDTITNIKVRKFEWLGHVNRTDPKLIKYK